MSLRENTTWKIDFKDAEGYNAANFSQEQRPNGNASRVSRGRCGSQYCREVEVDRAKYFDGSDQVNAKEAYFPLRISVTETSAGSGIARVRFLPGSFR